MSRKSRHDTVSGESVHHILQRGLNGSFLFKRHDDHDYYRSLILRYKEKYGISIYNYCFMPNHLHLLVYTKGMLELSRFVQSLSLAYSAYYRSTYDYSGYLWQGRYKNFPIQGGGYLLECARYIERDPLRAGNMHVADLSEYEWSSYRYYAAGVEDAVITDNPVFITLADTPEGRREKYREHILAPRPYEKVLDDVFNVRV